jgi:hypothetical protein
MMVATSHQQYIDDVQTMFDTLQSEVNTRMRIVWRDSKKEPIATLESIWNFSIIDSGEPSGCEEALIIKESQVHDYTLSFGDVTDKQPNEIEPQYVEISNAIETSTATKGCNAQYKLQAWDSDANSYIEWEDLVLDFASEVPHYFSSHVEFSKESGDFYGWFFYEDLSVLKSTRFVDADGNFAMKFRILALIPGSTIHGPATDKEELIHAEFKIKLIADEDVVTCA